MAAPKPHVMSVDEFKQQTTPPRVRKALAPIDDELRQFQAYGFQAESAINHLMRIIAAIQGWYARKARKIAAARAGDHVLTRKLVVDTLLQQCVKRVAWERYNYKKMIHTGNYRGINPANKALAPGYSVERTQFTQMKAVNYTATGQINPIGGSFAHDIHENRAPHSGAPAMQVIAAKTFDQLTAADFQLLQQTYSHALDAG